MKPNSIDSNVDTLLCPKCKKGELFERVPRQFFVKNFLFFIPLRRYKCYYCNSKPYVHENSIPKKNCL